MGRRGALCCGSSRSAGPGAGFGSPEGLDLAVPDPSGRGAVRPARGHGCLGLVDAWRGAQRPRTRWVAYASSRSLTGAVAGLIALELERRSTSRRFSPRPPRRPSARRFSTSPLRRSSSRSRGHGSPFASFCARWLPSRSPHCRSTCPALRFWRSAIKVSPWVLPLFLAPALAAQRSFVLYQAERRLASDLAEANKHLERANLSFATALVATLDARDRYTAGHSAAVAIYARDIAARMGLSEAETQLATCAALFTTSARSGFLPGFLKSPARLPSRSGARWRSTP